MKQVIDPRLLGEYIAHNETTQSRLAASAGISRQRIHQLLKVPGERCSDEIALLIEAHLHVERGALFREADEPADRSIKSSAAA